MLPPTRLFRSGMSRTCLYTPAAKRNQKRCRIRIFERSPSKPNGCSLRQDELYPNFMEINQQLFENLANRKNNRKDKCSAVAEMGDRLATVNMGRELGALPPFWGGELGPHLT